MHTSSMFADSKLANFSHQDRQTHDWLMLSAVMLYAAWLSNGNWEKKEWNVVLEWAAGHGEKPRHKQWCNLTFLTTCPQGKLDMKIGCPE
jgi:hypothetical protein